MKVKLLMVLCLMAITNQFNQLKAQTNLFMDETGSPASTDLHTYENIGVGASDIPAARIQIFNGIHQEGGIEGTRPFLVSGRIQSIVSWTNPPNIPGQITPAPQPIWSYPTATSYFTVANQGFVGINANDPLSKLHLRNGIFTISSDAYEESSSRWEIHGTNRAFAIKDKQIERYRFWINKEDGNVGIGTDTPFEKLEVEGNALINGYVHSQTNSGYIKMYSANANYAHFLTDRSKFYFNKSIFVNGGVSSYGTNDLNLQTNGSTKMTVKTNGQVNIGTLHINSGAHANYKLSVDGTIVSKKVVVTLDNWADHVFDKNYKLKPLAEVEAFITKENHLPEMPSEQKVLEEGIELGEMNKLLLLKVEELTLYLIQIQKEIDELKNDRL